MKRVGAHVSAEGGVSKAPRNAAAIGAGAFALFVKNQLRWNGSPLSDEEAARFRESCSACGFESSHILPHAGYLINLGSPDEMGLRQSRASFLDEMRRCQKLGLRYLNVHPGSHKNQMSEGDCLARIAGSVRIALAETEGVAVVFESTAGQGGYLGRTFEQIATLLELVGDPRRTGVCLDTCHLFGAGYDLRTREGYEGVMADFGRIVGLPFLRGWHLNESKGDLGSRVDRHRSLGEGLLGIEPFRCIMQDPRMDEMPLILETPDPERWEREIRLLRGMAAEEASKPCKMRKRGG